MPTTGQRGTALTSSSSSPPQGSNGLRERPRTPLPDDVLGHNKKAHLTAQDDPVALEAAEYLPTAWSSPLSCATAIGLSAACPGSGASRQYVAVHALAAVDRWQCPFRFRHARR
jgi:hypothetical protein